MYSVTDQLNELGWLII